MFAIEQGGDPAVTGTHDDFASREPSRRGPGRLRLSRIIVPTNMVLAGILSVLSFARVVGVTDISAYLGTVFLIGALVPSNLLRFERFAHGRKTRALARLRRPLGISAGVWFVAHSVVSVWEFFDLSLPLLPQFTRTGIVLGLVATLVFVAMLLTSTDRAQRALGRNWKRLLGSSIQRDRRALTTICRTTEGVNPGG